ISTDIVRLIAIFAVIGCLFNYIFLTVLVLIAIPFVKKFTDQLGYDEPPKLGDPYDNVLLQFRRITGDPVLPTTTKQLTSTPAADAAAVAPAAAPAAKAAPVKAEPFRGKTWLAAYINTL